MVKEHQVHGTFAVDNDGIISGNLDLEINTQATTKLDLMGTSGNFQHVKLNHASVNAFLEANTAIDGNLTIAAGALTCTTEAGDARTLTVAGTTSITGTLTATSQDLVLGSGITNAFAVVVNSGGTFNGGSGTHTYGSLNVHSSATLFAFSSGTTTLNGKSNGLQIFGTSATDRITAAGTLTIDTAQSPVVLNCADTTGINNLTMNSGSGRVLRLGNATTIGGNLTISAGEVNTDSSNNYALTVSGHVSIDGTLTGNASAISVGSMIINSGGTYSATSGTTTVTSENASHAFRCSGGGTFTNNDGTLEIQTAAQTRLKMNGTGNVHHLTVNHASCQLHMESDSSTTVEGNLTITAGIVNTNTEGGASRNLTVTGQLDMNGGTLTLNSSTVNIGNLDQSGGTINGNTSTINLNTGTVGGWVWYRTGGTWNYNTSTVVYKENGKHMEGEFYNLTIECASSTHTGVWRADGIASTIMKCANNLTVKEGIWKRDSASETMTIDGNVVIEDGGTLGQTSATGADNFGSLTINSGGTYNATSGTTTFTSTTSNYSLVNDGTFTHNKGTVKVDFETSNFNNPSRLKVNELFNLEVEMNRTSDYVYLQKVSGDTITILGDLHMIKGDFEDHTNSDKYVIHGQTIIEANARFGANTNWHTGDITHHGLVVLNGGTYYRSDAGGTVKMGGIRNIGGSIL